MPFDLLWLDSTWRLFNTTYGNGGCCFEWRNTFKDPKAMFDSCYAQNVKMVGLHIRSILDNGPEYHLLDKAREQGNVLISRSPRRRRGVEVSLTRNVRRSWWWENEVINGLAIRIGV